VASKDRPVKQRLREFLEAERPAAITEAVWQKLLMRLAPVSESYLRDLLRQTEIPFHQPYAGVRQHTFPELEQSLRELETVYARAVLEGNHELARYCRRQVIAAKDRARFHAGNPRTPPHRQAQKQEMVEWMLVWLDNPLVFPAWVEARKRVAVGLEDCAPANPDPKQA